MNDSPFGLAHQHGDCYATWYAKKKAAELIGHFKFNESDREDIEQTLLLKLIERWPRFDADRRERAKTSPGREGNREAGRRADPGNGKGYGYLPRLRRDHKRLGAERQQFREAALRFDRDPRLGNRQTLTREGKQLKTARGTYEQYVRVPKGEPANFLTAAEVRAKFDGLTAPYLSARRRDELASALLALDAARDIGGILRLTRPAADERRVAA